MTFFVRLVPCDKKSRAIKKLTLSMPLRGFKVGKLSSDGCCWLCGRERVNENGENWRFWP